MSKYEPLGEFLRNLKVNEVTLTFEKIEKILGFDLPEKSSGGYPWWSNNPDNNVMTKVWLDAGWRTKNLRLQDQQVTFHRVAGSRDASSDGEVIPLADLPPLARNVLSVLAKRSGRSVAQEALTVLIDALK